MGGTNAQLPVGCQMSLSGQRPAVALSSRRTENRTQGKDDRN
jgi:hypothetical protein